MALLKSGKKAVLRALLFMAAMCGLCASAQTITTAATPPAPSAGPKARIAVLLPLRSATLGPAAEAVRAGIQAAYDYEPQNVTLNLVETDGSASGVLSAYAAAVASNDMVIGPLSRSEVTTLVQSGRISAPTIALGQPEHGEGEVKLPPRMLAMGLSTEEEARQAASWIADGAPRGAAFIVTTSTPWQRRAAKAFASHWQARGLTAQTIEIGLNDGYLNGNHVAQLRKRVRAEVPAVVFVALDGAQAAQVRSALGAETAMYGTSQLNNTVRTSASSPMPMDSGSVDTRAALEGILLVDIPWQIQPDHPAVMVYPQLLGQNDPPPSADQARLYALGIDAYRVARELALSRTRFELDGVTGRLNIRYEPGAAHFDRVEQQAVWRDGRVVPVQPR